VTILLHHQLTTSLCSVTAKLQQMTTTTAIADSAKNAPTKEEEEVVENTRYSSSNCSCSPVVLDSSSSAIPRVFLDNLTDSVRANVAQKMCVSLLTSDVSTPTPTSLAGGAGTTDLQHTQADLQSCNTPHTNCALPNYTQHSSSTIITTRSEETGTNFPASATHPTPALTKSQVGNSAINTPTPSAEIECSAGESVRENSMNLSLTSSSSQSTESVLTGTVHRHHIEVDTESSQGNSDQLAKAVDELVAHSRRRRLYLIVDEVDVTSR
jgi:hypothetical protein